MPCPLSSGFSRTKILGENTVAKFSNTTIISAGMDETIKMWNIENEKCIKTFFGHTDFVNSLVKFSDNVFFSCSWDQKIKMWDIETGQCIKTFIGHIGYVKTLDY